MQTAVSVMPLASLASVFPVQGLTISASSDSFGPSGSASVMLCMTRCPVTSSARTSRASARPKRVSVVQTVSLAIGRTS